jgi:DNA topoisomerase-1
MRVRWKGARAFLGCSAYPKCKNSKPLPPGVRLERKPQPEPETAGVSCEKCGRPMVIRTGSRGKFIACTGYPRCRNTHPLEKLDELRASRPLGGEEGHKPAATAKPKAAQAPADRKKTTNTGTGGGTRRASDDGNPPAGFAFTRTGRLVVEDWPTSPLHCPECGGEMTLKAGRWGPFYSCSNFPKCKVSANLRGEAKKRAANEGPVRPPRPKPVPTDIECEECGAKMVLRTSRTGQVLGCGNYPKCKNTRPVPAALIGSTANNVSS